MNFNPLSLVHDLDIKKYEDWLIFDRRLSAAIESGDLKKINPLHIIYMNYEEWYVDRNSGDIFVYVAPDEKTLPKWEKVDVFSEPQIEESRDVRQAGLKIIPTGLIDEQMFQFLQFVLSTLASDGMVERLSVQDSGTRDRMYYREVSTGSVYCLSKMGEVPEYHWERVSNTKVALPIQ